MPDATSTWPNGARLAVSFSLMFEAGGQPISGAGGVIPDPIQHGILQYVGMDVLPPFVAYGASYAEYQSRGCTCQCLPVLRRGRDFQI